jgi:hypothetical protein
MKGTKNLGTEQQAANKITTQGMKAMPETGQRVTNIEFFGLHDMYILKTSPTK